MSVSGGDDVPTDMVGNDASQEDTVLGGRYRLHAVIGRGGMGRVWSAHDTVLDRPVAIKEIEVPPGPERAERSERAVREARAAARITHEHVVQVYDVLTHDDRPWIVLEQVPGASLAETLQAGGPLSPVAVVRLGQQLLLALRAAHDADVLHRDVTPGNVLLRPDGRAVLGDFGIARVAGESTLTDAGLVIGSPSCLAPERVAGGAADPATDLWSLGCVLYAAATGATPFERGALAATLHAVRTEEPVWPSGGYAPLVPVLRGLLAKNPFLRLSAETTRLMLLAAESAVAAGVTGPAPADIARGRRPGQRVARPTAPPPLGPGGARPRQVSAAAVPHPDRTLPPGPPPAITGVVLRTDPAGGSADPADESDPAGRDLPGGAAEHPSPPALGRAAQVAHPEQATPPAHRPDARPTRQRGADTVRHGRRGLLAAGLVALILAAAGTTVAIGRDAPNRAGDRAAVTTPGPGTGVATTDPPAGTSPPPAASTSQTTAPPADGPADGLRRYTDETGFVVDVPAGWTVRRDGSRVDFVEPGGGRFLRIDQTRSPQPDPVEDWLNQEEEVSQRLGGYQRVRLEAVDFQGFDAADWEFTWTADTGPLRVLNRNTITGPDRAYALYWSTSAGDFEASRGLFDRIAASFQPAG